MAQKVQKVRRKLEKKGFDGIECTEVGKCIRLEGEMTEWTDIVKAGKAAAKFGYKGVLNEEDFYGKTPSGSSDFFIFCREKFSSQ